MANPTLNDRTFQQQFEQAQAAAELANLTEPRALAQPPGTGIEPSLFDSAVAQSLAFL